MNLDSGGKASNSEGENSEKRPMALGAGDANRVQEPLASPYSRDYISRRGGFLTSSIAAHNGRSTDVGGSATAPRMAKDATSQSAANGTVCIPCPPPAEGGFPDKDVKQQHPSHHI